MTAPVLTEAEWAAYQKFLAAASGPQLTEAELAAEIDRIHRPVTEEAERWPDDECEPPVTEECTVTIEVCSECGHTYADDQVKFRLWPCPTYRAAHPERGKKVRALSTSDVSISVEDADGTTRNVPVEMGAFALTEAEVAAIEQRANDATPGPWLAATDNGRKSGIGLVGAAALRGQGRAGCIAVLAGTNVPQRHADTEFVANARTDIPALIASHRALLASVDVAHQTETERQTLVLNNQLGEAIADADRLAAALEAEQTDLYGMPGDDNGVDEIERPHRTPPHDFLDKQSDAALIAHRRITAARRALGETE